MHEFYADLHVHIGQARGRPVKVTASRDLTVDSLLDWAAARKGIDIVGIADAASPRVIFEIKRLLGEGKLVEVAGGGLLSDKGVLLVLGAEIETAEGAHFLTFLPDLESMGEFQSFLTPYVTNLDLSTQKARVGVREVIRVSRYLGGIFCPAHAFTPHKGAYGCWIDRLARGLEQDIEEVEVLELGLSADTRMASMIEETSRFGFLSNSDAHSLQNMGREYNLLDIQDKSFAEIHLAVAGKRGRSILANFGMHPRLGKYHRTYCPNCDTIAAGEPPVITCENCGNPQVVMGVYDRVFQISDYPYPRCGEKRAPYYYRVPLHMIPGLGPKSVLKLIDRFGTETEIMEHTSLSDIAKVAGQNPASYIGRMRNNRLSILPGGGGKYGKVQKN